MSSVIHYRFKAGAAEWSRVSFEGHALTLGELKRAIAEQRKLTPQQQSTLAGAGAGLGEAAGGGGRMLQDFELVLMNVDTNEGALVDPCARQPRMLWTLKRDGAVRSPACASLLSSECGSCGCRVSWRPHRDHEKFQCDREARAGTAL
jgi:hypothetical protein